MNSSITLKRGRPEQIEQEVKNAIEYLGPEGFILSPVDALFPDTPWESVKIMINSWKKCQVQNFL